MNWRDPHSEELEKVAIAIIKLPAKVHASDPRYGGAILLNPGDENLNQGVETVAYWLQAGPEVLASV